MNLDNCSLLYPGEENVETVTCRKCGHVSSTFQDANQHQCVVKAECIDTMTDPVATMTDPVATQMLELSGIDNLLGMDTSAILDMKENNVAKSNKEVSCLLNVST